MRIFGVLARKDDTPSNFGELLHEVDQNVTGRPGDMLAAANDGHPNTIGGEVGSLIDRRIALNAKLIEMDGERGRIVREIAELGVKILGKVHGLHFSADEFAEYEARATGTSRSPAYLMQSADEEEGKGS